MAAVSQMNTIKNRITVLRSHPKINEIEFKHRTCNPESQNSKDARLKTNKYLNSETWLDEKK